MSDFIVADTEYGKVGGIQKVSALNAAYTAFLGIRYATPPVGYLRFKVRLFTLCKQVYRNLTKRLIGSDSACQVGWRLRCNKGEVWLLWNERAAEESDGIRGQFVPECLHERPEAEESAARHGLHLWRRVPDRFELDGALFARLSADGRRGCCDFQLSRRCPRIFVLERREVGSSRKCWPERSTNGA